MPHRAACVCSFWLFCSLDLELWFVLSALNERPVPLAIRKTGHNQPGRGARPATTRSPVEKKTKRRQEARNPPTSHEESRGDEDARRGARLQGTGQPREEPSQRAPREQSSSLERGGEQSGKVRPRGKRPFPQKRQQKLPEDREALGGNKRDVCEVISVGCWPGQGVGRVVL